VLVALTGSVRSASADDIPCPVQKATWVVTTPLPDPWSSQVEVGTLVKRFSAFIDGREWIICRYANGDDPHQHSVYDYLPIPVPGPGPSTLKVTRPAFSNATIDEIDCPARQIAVGLKTAIPSPWTSTVYVFDYDGKTTEYSGGAGSAGSIVCRYKTRDHDVWGAGPSAILRPVKPDTGPGLTSTPKPEPSRPDTVAAPFGVTGVTLSTDAEVRAVCPTTVKFRGYITANAAGTVRYRVVHTGKPGMPKEMEFDRAEGRPVLFDVEVGGGDSTGSVSARPKPAAPGSMTAAPAPENRISGWARIEILAPRAGVARSDIASYVVSCSSPLGVRHKEQGNASKSSSAPGGAGHHGY
jgi:hypothetical protein